MTAIALLRHFPTDWNAETRLQGRADRPLSPEARAWLAGLALPAPWDSARLVASPLARARDTAAAFAEPALEPRLVEQSWGDWEGRLARDLLADRTSGFVPTHRLGWHQRPPGGETRAEVWARVRPALAALAAAPEPCVIVTHKGVMRLILGLAGAPVDAEGAVEIKRARLYPLRLGPDGSPRDPGPPLRLAAR